MSASIASSSTPGFTPANGTAAGPSTTSISTDTVIGEGSGIGRDFGTETRRHDVEEEEQQSSKPTIHALCQAGDVQALQERWKEGGCDVNERDASDVTPLHWAAINAQMATCEWLLEKGAEVDAIGGDLRATPLQWAARNGHLYILHLLMRHSADPNIRDTQGFNTLHLVTHSSVVMALLYVLQQPLAVDEKDTDGHTALMWAAWQGDAISVDLLIRHGASVHAIDNAKLTPLHWAAVKGSRACIKRLLEAGADVHAVEENGKTARMMAEELKALEPYRSALEEHGLDVQGGQARKGFSPRMQRYAILVGPTIFLFLIFSALSVLPIYSGIPMAIALFFAMHHILTRVVLGSKGSGDAVTGSPYYVAIITASIIWVGYAWLAFLVKGAMGRPLTQLVFATSLAICSFNFYRAIRADPGYSKQLENEEARALIEDLTSTGQLNGTVFCINCMNKKPLRAKHCRLCNRCTGRFDHHCPWIWNCVGYNNHPQFLLFVGSLVVGIVAFDMLVATYISESLPPVEPPAPTAYPTLCTVSPTLCAAGTNFPFLMSVTCWATLQLTWTIILLITQVMQVCRQMTTLEVSNLGRYGFMGGRGGSSLRDQGGAVAQLMARQGKGRAQLASVGAGAGPSGGDEVGELAVDDGLQPVASEGRPVRSSHAGGHSHGHGSARHHHRFGAVGKLCSAALNACTSGPMLQLLGLDRFTKGRALQGLRQSGDGGNPFDIGVLGNCQDFWTRGEALGVDYRALYEIPIEGFASKRVTSQGMLRSVRMTAGAMMTSRPQRGEYELVGNESRV